MLDKRSFTLRNVYNLILSTPMAWILVLVLFLEREHLHGQLNTFPSRNNYGKRLAILIPFIKDELSIIEENIDKYWDTYFPCAVGSRAAKHTDLLFYFNQDWASHPTLVPKLKSLIDRSKSRKCFNNIKFLMANLPAQSEEDKYPLGSSLMFFKAFELPTLVDEYSYMYWMEADQRPCKSGWLDQIYFQAVNNPTFWMIGSIIRDEQQTTTYSSFADHLNGNSLYRLDDPKFFDFLERVQEEFSNNKSRFLGSFDIAMYLVARHSISFEGYTSIKHHFVYTDFIQNRYRAKSSLNKICSASTTTYLVHGKYLTD